jgi:hypothetical protein
MKKWRRGKKKKRRKEKERGEKRRGKQPETFPVGIALVG